MVMQMSDASHAPSGTAQSENDSQHSKPVRADKGVEVRRTLSLPQKSSQKKRRNIEKNAISMDDQIGRLKMQRTKIQKVDARSRQSLYHGIQVVFRVVEKLKKTGGMTAFIRKAKRSEKIVANGANAEYRVVMQCGVTTDKRLASRYTKAGLAVLSAGYTVSRIGIGLEELGGIEVCAKANFAQNNKRPPSYDKKTPRMFCPQDIKKFLIDAEKGQVFVAVGRVYDDGIALTAVNKA